MEVKIKVKTKGWFEVRDKDGNLKQSGEIKAKEEDKEDGSSLHSGIRRTS